MGGPRRAVEVEDALTRYAYLIAGCLGGRLGLQISGGHLRFASLTRRARAWMPAGGRRMMLSMSTGTAGARVALSRATASQAKS